MFQNNRWENTEIHEIPIIFRNIVKAKLPLNCCYREFNAAVNSFTISCETIITLELDILGLALTHDTTSKVYLRVFFCVNKFFELGTLEIQ